MSDLWKSESCACAWSEVIDEEWDYDNWWNATFRDGGYDFEDIV